MNIKVTKITGIELLRMANGFTTGKESHMSLATAYRSGHTTIRTQIFFVECYDIPQYVAYHLRTHFSLHLFAPEEYGWMYSKRVDKGALDFREVCKSIACGMIEAEDRYDWDAIPVIADEVDALPDKFDRYAPTDFGFLISAEGLMILAGKRLCAKASKETREVVQTICELVEECDPDLYSYLVKPCVATGICRESKPCGFMASDAYRAQRRFYKALFNPKV